MSEETFADSDTDRVQGYAALPNLCIFLTVLDIISPVIHGSRCYLTKFQQLMLCLMRLRFNLSLIVLADIFKVSTTSASTVFHSVLHALYIRTKPFINWPERDCLHRTMPLEFKKYFGNKVTVITDCFEVFIERPSSLQTRAQSYSNYKHSNTIKYLIGIAPHGVVTFVSEGWGGRTSDKYLTENCSFLDNLKPGDLVLADRGFNIGDTVALMCAEVKIPAFTRGKSQL